MSKLISSKFPPGGFIYREVSVNWHTTPELAMLGLKEVARALQIVRIQNPMAGLNPDFEACVADVEAYTCARLHDDPRWCGEDVTIATSTIARSGASTKQPKKCASCGKRR